MDGVSGLHEPVPKRRREVTGAGRAAEHLQRLLARHEVGERLLAGADGERRRKTAQERRMPEALAGADQVDDLTLVDELDRPLDDDEQVFGGSPVLAQHDLTRAVDALLDGHGQRRELRLAQRVERREAAQELRDPVCVHRLHCAARDLVLQAPCNARPPLRASVLKQQQLR